MTSTFRIDELPAVRVSEAVVQARVRKDDVDALEMEPLGRSVDPIALDSIFEDDSFDGSITFRYERYDVTVTSDGDIVFAG